MCEGELTTVDFLGAAADSPYIIFISTSRMLRSIYIYNVFLCVTATMNYFECQQLEIGLEFVR